MKRMHIHISVDHLDQSIGFYNQLFGASPSVQKPDYAKWMLDDPRVNFALSQRGEKPGLNHLGIQAESDEELSDIKTRLDAADIANAQLNTPEDVWSHPQLQARARWREIDTPAGVIPAVLPPSTFQNFEARMDPVPRVGEHTEAILHELGYDADAIGALRAAKAV